MTERNMDALLTHDNVVCVGRVQQLLMQHVMLQTVR